MNNKKIQSLLKKKIVVLDGAMGTQLHKRGLPPGACPELWCLENQKVLLEVHKEYKKHGADIVYTCTFGANRLKLSQYGKVNVREVNKKLARIARKSVGENFLVAGDIGPTGHFVKPFGSLEFDEAVEIYKRLISIDGSEFNQRGLAYLYYRMKEYSRAFNIFISLSDPNFGDNIFLSTIITSAKSVNDKKELIQRLLQLAEGSRQYANLWSRIKKLGKEIEDEENL